MNLSTMAQEALQSKSMGDLRYEQLVTALMARLNLPREAVEMNIFMLAVGMPQ